MFDFISATGFEDLTITGKLFFILHGNGLFGQNNCVSFNEFLYLYQLINRV
jgi:hypothetical protein